MPAKSFEHTIPFYSVTDPVSQQTVSIPLVSVQFIRPNGNRVTLPLIFDTGASTVTLRNDFFWLFNVPSWTSGTPLSVNTAGNQRPVAAYQYSGRLEFLGKTVNCPINLQELPPNPLWAGLFGREAVFREFGFAFWESTRELYVTLRP